MSWWYPDSLLHHLLLTHWLCASGSVSAAGNSSSIFFEASHFSNSHVLLPLWKSGFLAGDTGAWDGLCQAYYPARVLRDLLEEYGDVPFHGI